MFPSSSPSPVSVHDFSAVESLFRELKIDPGLLRRLRAEFYKRAKSEGDVLDCLPVDLAESG